MNIGPIQQNYINHVALVLDASSSMAHRAQAVIKVADAQVKHLAQRSQELDQETRISVYVFADDVRCLTFDKDVLRLPSIAGSYRAHGNTALIDAAIQAQQDLDKTPELYGDHAFLTYILTDGQENRSRNRVEKLQQMMDALGENRTVAVFVPDQSGKFEAKKFGFPADNIAIWDTADVRGVESVGERIRKTTDDFMVARSTGLRGTRSVFSIGLDALNKNTVRTALKALDGGNFHVVGVKNRKDMDIRTFVEDVVGINYVVGQSFYQLMKTESIQPQKRILVREKSTGKIFGGPEARDLIGLPRNVEVRVKPDWNPDYDVFVQSTSVNRKLIPGTDLIVLS